MTTPTTHCPTCGHKGRSVKPMTIQSLVTEEARARADQADGFRFCATPSCDVTYYHAEKDALFSKRDVRVRIGVKDGAPPTPVCYCFDHTVEEIEAEVRETGSSVVADEIKDKCRAGLDRCEEANPKGVCCLGDVNTVIQAAQAESIASPAPDPDCCAPSATTSDSPRAGLWATGGAVVAAVLSSACCWLPLLLIGFGASAVGVAGFIEAYRPALLAVTAVLLAAGFYMVYRRTPGCEPGGSCAAPNPRLKRLNKIMLWGATVVVVLFALFPNYVGVLLGTPEVSAASSDERVADPISQDEQAAEVTLAVSGMT